MQRHIYHSAGHHPSALSFRGRSSFPDVEEGESNDTNKYDCLEKRKNGIPQRQVAQNNDRGDYEIEDNRSYKGDAALAAIDEDDPRQKQADDEKDGEPVDLADGVCKGRVEVDQEDHDGKDGIDHLLKDGSPPCCSLLSVIS